MSRCIITQFNILKKRNLFKFSFIIMMLICCAAFIISIISNGEQYQPDLLSYRDAFVGSHANALSNIIVILLPIICVLPFCDSYIEDKNANRLPVILQSCTRKEYYISKLTVSGAAGFITVFVPMTFNLILCAIAYPSFSYNDLTGLASNQNTLYAVSSNYMNYMPFKSLFIEQPFLYCLLFILFCSVYAGCGCLFAYSMSFFIKNRAMIIVPFFIFNILTSVLSSPAYSILKMDTSIENYIISSAAYESVNFIAYGIIAGSLVLISLALIPVNIKKLGDVL